MRLQDFPRYWQCWFWLFGASLPFIAFVTLDWVLSEFPNLYGAREQVNRASNQFLLAASVGGLLIMVIASVRTKCSLKQKLGLCALSVLAVPCSIVAGTVVGIALTGLPVD